MNIGYLGPVGSYSEEAAAEKFPDAVLHSYPAIEQVFEAVARGRIERGVVPIENMIQGPVTETQDGLYEYHDRVCILDMLMLNIVHALGALGTQDQIREVLSKDQALHQCSTFLRSELSSAERIAVQSTSAAVASVMAAKEKSKAAIASERAMEKYGLPIIKRNIGDAENNKTRFAVLAPASEAEVTQSVSSATAFVIYPPGDRVGMLEEILAVISHDHGLSLSSIHSRPDKRGAFRFYMELEGHIGDHKVRECIADLKKILEDDFAEVYVFGSYPRLPFVETRIRTIGIVGGTGKMGQWFRRFFETAGYEVLITGRSTELTLEQCVKQSQAVLINVPIENSVEMAVKVGPLLSAGQLVMDNSSVKGQVVKELLDATDDGVEVIGMHTVFGPGIEHLKKQNVVFSRTPKSGDLSSEFENIFYKHGAKISYADEATHDQQMAFHQNLEHFTKIVLARVLAEEVRHPEDTTSYSSPNSSASLRTMARVLSIDLDLLAEIQSHNKQGAGMIQRYVQFAQELLEEIENGNLDALKKTIQKSISAIGPEQLDEFLKND